MLFDILWQKPGSDRHRLKRKQQETFTRLETTIHKALANNNMDDVNVALYDMADFFKVELEYTNTDEFVEYFDSADVIKI